MKKTSLFFPPASNTSASNIAIVTVPNAGHIKILIRLVKEARKQDPNLSFTFILTSWTGYEIRDTDLEALKKASNNELIILQSKNTANRKEDTFGRVRELLTDVVIACAHFELIMYDFISPEGYLAAKILPGVRSICLEPSYIGSFDRSSAEYHDQLLASKDDIDAIEKDHRIHFRDELTLVSGTLSLLSSKNLVFSWEKFIRVGDFEKNSEEEKSSCYFMRPSPRSIPPLNKEFSYINSEKKVVYFSLGTIASGIVWDEVEGMENNYLHDFIRLLYKTILAIFTHRSDLILIISTGRPIRDVIGDMELPENIHVYETVPQADLLYYVDLFITHCGANSVNEAIDAETPMIGFPLMFDQPKCARAMGNSNLGPIFPPEKEEVYFGGANAYYRPPFYLDNIENAQRIFEETIDKTLKQDYSEAFAHLKSAQTLYFKSFSELIKPEEKTLLQKQENYGDLRTGISL